LAQQAPKRLEDFRHIYGMSAGQVQRYGRQILRAIQESQGDPVPRQPQRPNRPPDEVLTRYEKLHAWRKQCAQKRGVESDVILSRETLWAIAWKNPRSTSELSELDEMSEWRCQVYGDEIVNLLNHRGRH
jgi:ribonuclease D